MIGRRKPTVEPTVAYVVNADDEMIDCLIERIDATTWRIVPVRHVAPDDVRLAAVNVVPEGCTVEFIFEEVPGL